MPIPTPEPMPAWPWSLASSLGMSSTRTSSPQKTSFPKVKFIVFGRDPVQKKKNNLAHNLIKTPDMNTKNIILQVNTLLLEPVYLGHDLVPFNDDLVPFITV